MCPAPRTEARRNGWGGAGRCGPTEARNCWLARAGVDLSANRLAPARYATSKTGVTWTPQCRASYFTDLSHPGNKALQSSTVACGADGSYYLISSHNPINCTHCIGVPDAHPSAAYHLRVRSIRIGILN
jgi:hypothetical protein